MEIAVVKKKHGVWSKKSLAGAVGDISDKECTLGQAAKKYGIPKSTLFGHVKQKTNSPTAM
jgi:helix-turn-helix, Psq domain